MIDTDTCFPSHSRLHPEPIVGGGVPTDDDAFTAAPVSRRGFLAGAGGAAAIAGLQAARSPSTPPDDPAWAIRPRAGRSTSFMAGFEIVSP